ncbi:hypothetical protein KDL29_03045 [bacterium]|nr:hypothetical protein [bacterium]UNM09802.1 MAG: hypothetical protein H7A35_07010 [Planctomycetales bacterium]
MTRCLPLLLLALVLCASCEQLQRAANKPGGVFGPSEKVLREYHDSRWQAVVNAVAEGSDEVVLPDEPEVPKALEKLNLEQGYQALAANRTSEELSWQALIEQSDLSMRFSAEVLDVLERNDADSISQIVPQIDDYASQQETAMSDWRALRSQLRGSLDSLQQDWDSAWPDNEFDFDLLAQVERIQADQLGRLSPERIAALTHYHDNEFSRLATDYLEYEPAEAEEISAVAHVPADCEGISDATRRLEAALIVRHALDSAIVRDRELVESYVPGVLGKGPISNVSIPDTRYGSHRARLAVARLELYSMLDGLVTDVLDVMIYDVNREWTLAWPGNELENNIFAYAGVQQTVPRLEDPYEAPASKP